MFLSNRRSHHAPLPRTHPTDTKLARPSRIHSGTRGTYIIHLPPASFAGTGASWRPRFTHLRIAIYLSLSAPLFQTHACISTRQCDPSCLQVSSPSRLIYYLHTTAK
ncbi:hypothetical protein FIBSPDRAFT_133055 [Athelia psychrophila]|uniref:Uncharacterized protein n=1 Tax=Athelia psychrophila TaxID=1759441 RepID=A0A166CAA8_9AGAM|nr:hypothetical protein FIBSPDRAFT_133055 [Fibularhizoctonia sp. CBS 109695]